jgi:hypothetical protein
MSNRKNVLINIVLLISSFIFCIFLTELLCRFLYTQKKVGHHASFYEYDPLLGWRHKRNSGNYRITKEYSVKISFNSKGIRGPEYSYEKNKGKFRILILGDSFAEGYVVDFENLFSEILNKELMLKGIYCEVINAGTAGYSTDQELLFFENEGKKYKPDLTVLMFYDNDVWYNNQPKYWRGYKPLFKFIDNNFILTNTPVPKKDTKQNIGLSRMLQKQKPTVNLAHLKKWLRNHSRLYALLSYKIRNIGGLYKIAIKLHLAELPKSQLIVTSKKKEDAVIIPNEFMVWEKNYNNTIRDAWKITEAVMVKLQSEVFLVNGKLLVFYIPNKASIYRNLWQASMRKYNISDEKWSIDKVGLELQDVCIRNSIDFINPTKIFTAAADKLKAKGENLYCVDGHWNISGNRLTGEILADFIYHHYLVKE